MSAETPETPDLPEGEALPEDWNRIVESITEAVSRERKRESRLGPIAGMMADFLTRKPAPPQSWLDRLGDRAAKFDYHQIQLPPNVPAGLEELEALDWLKENCSGSFEALEHYLLTRNHFLFGDGHYPAAEHPCPMPLLMLETSAEAVENEEDEDRCFLIFADGSGYAWNLDDSGEEELLQDATPLLRRHADELSKLAWHPPVEGVDYGALDSNPET